MKKALGQYLQKLFGVVYESSQAGKEVCLEDNPLNRFAVAAYAKRFGSAPRIKWQSRPSFFRRAVSLVLLMYSIFRISLAGGVSIRTGKKKHKVMMEAIHGLYEGNGRYNHDDFLVDGDKLKPAELLLYSRGVPQSGCRLKGYNDARRSAYAHFVLGSLPVSLKALALRVVPKYLASGLFILARTIFSEQFTLFYSLYYYFVSYALPYESVFSNYEVMAELSQCYYSVNHIAEAIVCRQRGAKHYIWHYSDTSGGGDELQCAFLGCNKYLLWGRAHIKGSEGKAEMLLPTGFPFKRFIKEVMRDKKKVLSKMGINARGKIVAFFDESFGGDCLMTEDIFIAFWETILKLALTDEKNTILAKPKTMPENLSPLNQERFLKIRSQLLKRENFYLIDALKWSFVETIGVADMVVTQGMTSSATIAIICGIEGLYFDQANYRHPFAECFKEKVVFDDPELLINMIRKIVAGEESPLKNIPEQLLREYDEYADDRGIGIFREVLTGGRDD